MSFLLQVLWSQLFFTPPYPTADFSGQTVIVTGSNVGLGLEAARHVARLNCAKLILAVRNVSKGEQAKESILASTKRTSDCVEVWPLDLSSSESVKAFAKRAEGLERVDVLVENAGLSAGGWEVMEGMESSVQVNVINTFLLALLMLPKLRATGERFGTTPHLEIVSSEAHFMASFKERNEDDIYAKLNDEKAFDLFERYPLSKLLEVLFVRELVKHTDKLPVITTVNPGFCQSELGRDGAPFLQFIKFLRYILARSTEVGSRTLLAGACAGEGSHGMYMSDCTNQKVAPWIETEDGAKVQKRVYEQTLAVLERIEPGISKNV